MEGSRPGRMRMSRVSPPEVNPFDECGKDDPLFGWLELGPPLRKLGRASDEFDALICF